MLSERRAHAVIPAPNPDRLRPFYEDVLGFKPVLIQPGAVIYAAGDGSRFALSGSGAGGGMHTEIAFTVPDLAAEMAQLRARGVTFEEYETPKTEDGIAELPAGRAAWLKDPDGNIVGLIQFSEPV